MKLNKLYCDHNISHNDAGFRSIGGIVPISVSLLPRALFLFFATSTARSFTEQDAILPYRVGRAAGSVLEQ